MRTQSLRHAANRFLCSDRQGKYRDRKHRAYVIHKMINDLYVIKQMPPSWQALTTSHVQNLVNHWKKQRINPATIMRYMTIIRRFLPYMDCHIEHIDNKSLQLIRQYKRKRIKKGIEANMWNTIQDEEVRLVMAFQTEFGLTFSEAIRVLPVVHVRDNNILITREVAFNSNDRKIPVVTDSQNEVITQFHTFTQSNNSLTELVGHECILFKWRKAMKTLRLPPRKSLRYLYAQQRFKTLLPIHGHYKTCVMIKDEMGIQSRNTLWLYLK